MESQTPNEELTGKIVAALREAGLIAEKHQNQVAEKMQEGTAQHSDWRLWVETPMMESAHQGGEVTHGEGN